MSHLHTSRRSRALSMLEVVVAMSILALAVVFFGSAMIVATDSEAKAAEHTQAIMIGNYLLESARRDAFFWDNNAVSPVQEWSGPACKFPANCWPKMNPANADQNGVTLPPYADSIALAPGPATWHPGFNPPASVSVSLPPYHYIWRADPVDQSKFSGNKGVATVTIEIYIDQDGPQDVYVVKGLNREQ